MTLGLRESRLRQRRRRRLAILKWSVLFLVFVALGLWAYESGSALAEQEVLDLRQEIGRLTETVSELRRDRAALIAQLEASRQREEDWARRYAEDVPTGKGKEIYGLVQERLVAGVDPDRLAFVVRAADNEDECDGKPVTKRFILPTPGHKDGNDSVGFADGAIRITGQGEAATDGRGGRYGWFDPARPVTIHFTHLGGKSSEVTGKLPLYHTVVKGSSEYRFTVVAGEQRGFVYVTGDRCAYP